MVKTAANLCKRICYGNKDKLMAGVIVAGYDAVDGGLLPRLFVFSPPLDRNARGFLFF